MRVDEVAVLRKYAHHFQPRVPIFREDKCIQIVVLRETKSHAVFTTEGQVLHVEKMAAGIEDTTPIQRAVMYKRKQIAPERRTGKTLLRQFGLCPSQDVKDKDGNVVVPKGECQIAGHACGVCPDCILYGFVVTSSGRSGAQRARVLTDSGFVVRDLSQVTRDIKLNAINETTSGGIVPGAYSHRENLMPEVFIPTVETLVDVTMGEFVYVMGNILKTTRYGAESRREGFVRNHITGIYFSDVEIFSNLEMSQLFYDALSSTSFLEKSLSKNFAQAFSKGLNGSSLDNLSLYDFTSNLTPVMDKCIEKAVGRITAVTDQEISELIHDIGVIYSSQELLSVFLRELNDASMAYAGQTQLHMWGQVRNAQDKRHTHMAM